MSKINDLKSFLVDNKIINVNVIDPMIDGVADDVASDAATFKVVATPVAAPVAGAVDAHSTVVLTCSLADALIYYTIDGSAPTNAKTLYTGPIEIAAACTVKAIAYRGYRTPSNVLSAAYTITITATPTATPVAGAVALDSTVELATATVGATIYYTTNGDTPTAESDEYVAPIAITEALTIKAIAIKANQTASGVLSAAYTIAP